MSQRTDLMINKNAFQWLEEDNIQTNITQEVNVDILVVGAGHAGTAAARGAIEENPYARIIVIEQQEKTKQRILGNGEIGHINSKWQESKGVSKVDVDEFVNDWQLRTNNRSNYELIRKYASNCGECFDWMFELLSEEEKAEVYPMLENPSEHMPVTLNHIHSYSGTAKMPVKVQNSLIKKNQEKAESLGVSFWFDTKAIKLITHGNAVTGAIILKGDSLIQVSTEKGVILAAGDYSKNKQMCRDLLTEAADLIDQNTDWSGHGWNGDGLRLGMLAGGRMEPRSHAALGGNYSMPGFEVIGATAVLRVNKYGKRYSNEGFGTHVLAATQGAKQPNGMLYGVFDNTVLEQTKYQAHCHAVFDYCREDRIEKLKYDLERAKKAGEKGVPISAIKGSEKAGMPRILYAADTIEELATYMYPEKKEQDTFLQTVNRYNQICEVGKDVDFGKETSLLFPVKEGPFFAVGQLKDSHHPIGQSFKLLVTVGGLLIDANQQVLDEEYEPLKGLFATGNTSGCRFGFQYSTSVSGQSISMAQTLGCEVGKYVSTL